jgi:hypothetical protein
MEAKNIFLLGGIDLEYLSFLAGLVIGCGLGIITMAFVQGATIDPNPSEDGTESGK